jgi:hypothetical protein
VRKEKESEQATGTYGLEDDWEEQVRTRKRERARTNGSVAQVSGNHDTISIGLATDPMLSRNLLSARGISGHGYHDIPSGTEMTIRIS